ncbi:MarR family winged helix-turn-helix transcriptional regulator [Streptomyces sp. NPDC050560]|uniref:MarR family winged helix-turn-helix transcriptional regulator n=1 Tax=Streptomyces sp. NPDC050560 TaxID=3365630 RepID=UPI0037892F30
MRNSPGVDTGAQDAADTGPEALGHALRRAELALVGRKRGALRAFDLTVPQYDTLTLLSRADGMSAAQLARACLVTPQTMATVLSNLEDKGLVERRPSPLHQKVLVTCVTEEGRAVAARGRTAVAGVMDRLTGGFSAAETAEFRRLLDRAADLLEPSDD